MRFSEILEDATSRDEYANIATALRLIQDHIRKNNLKSADVATETVIRIIQNTGLSAFSYDDLIAANRAIPSMKNIVQSISPDTVSFSKEDGTGTSNTDDMAASVDNPRQTVSNMAKSAMIRRQD